MTVPRLSQGLDSALNIILNYTSFLPEMVRIVVLAAANNELWRFEGFYIQHLPERISERLF